LQLPAFGWVREFEDRSITSVVYVSDRLAAASFELLFKDFFTQLGRRTLLPAVRELDSASEYREWLVSILDDLAWVDSSIGRHVPIFRGSSQVSFLSGNGWETHAMARTRNRLHDDSLPLEGWRHVGTEPLVMLDLRLAERPEFFETARAIAQRVKRRLDEGLRLDSDERPEWFSVDVVRHALQFWPELVRAADIWQDEFLPCMNQEHLFLLHSGFLSKEQWHPRLPRSDRPLPIPEGALLTGIRSRDGWIHALRSMFQTLRNMVAIAMADEQGNVSIDDLYTDRLLPSPVRTEKDSLIVYGFPIPEGCPAPKEMMPRVSILEDWSIASYSDGQLADILATRANPLAHGQLATEHRWITAAYLDFGGLARMLTPWVRYGLQQRSEDFHEGIALPVDPEVMNVEINLGEILEVVTLFESLGTMSSCSWIDAEGGTRSQSVYWTEPHH
jgi:hypothetical protein